ncbi:uncharacterized protein DUF4197 [Limnobacter thiooxidans]|uniref:DUF4197 domain-containing protein n=1 Tax=Limnobacter thiooxidans TaxID=131080 RepID=A0AA86MDE8_9BURK|nr:uncharacterized protein DUF4197 [Limnobacter thiooxidans]BET24535.1 DUF4197 domain-containing protein [Limnobacter thiooxidans]
MRLFRTLLLLVTFTVTGMASAADLSAITSKEAVTALRTTLTKGAEAAVGSLGKTDGFLGNPAARIQLPEFLAQSKGMLKMVGMGGQLDQVEVSMNRAAEAAVPQAKAILQKTIQNMTVEDAKQVLGGGETAVTDFFRSKTQSDLYQQLLPIVKGKTAQVGLAQQYNALAEKGSRFGLVKAEDANLEGYVTNKALDALFLMVAEEEKAIRANPVAAGSAVLKKVFGSLK